MSGIQAEGVVSGNIIITQVVEYTSTSIHVHGAIPLLPTVRFSAYHNHIRSCYISPSTYHPYGVLLFTYVDEENLRTSIVRGQINQYQDYYWILNSPRLSVSHIPYVNVRDFSYEPEGPLLICPNNKAVIVLQNYFGTMNSFFWHGGYRVAGIALTDGAAGQTVQVTRAGIVDFTGLPFPLQTGFNYYANNSGDLHPTISSTELYARNGWDDRIGQCVNPSEIILDYEVFENINSRV